MNNTELQKKLDIEKWLESETKGRDMCGAYDFCSYCEDEVDFPCANAYERHQSKQNLVQAPAAPVVEEVAAEVVPEPQPAPAKKARKKRVVLTFEQKLELASEEMRDLHQLVSGILETANLRSSMTQASHNFMWRRRVAVKIHLYKRYLQLHLALDPADPKYDKIPHKDDSDKKTYVNLPFAFKVASPLSVRRLRHLAEDLTD